MNDSESAMAKQIAQVAIAYQAGQTGHAPAAVTVVMSEDTLVITMHDALTRRPRRRWHGVPSRKPMNVFHMNRWCTVTALVALGTSIGLGQRIAAEQPQPSLPPQQAPSVVQDRMEVLTRGLVHEAFAETITFDPEPGIVAADRGE